MKQSGVEWIGEIPRHWNLKPLKHLISITGGGTPNTESAEYWDGDIPWVSPKDMKSDKISATEDYITEKGLKESTSNLIDPGALLIVFRSGILQRTIPVAINTVPVSINQDIKSLTSVDPNFYIRFLFWFIKGNESHLLLEWSKKGVTVESLETDYLRTTIQPLPPLDEQRLISRYLDKKTQQIDTLIEKIEKKIELLKEQRTSLISHYVTKGLDPNVEMKDSGVEWIGKVPKHWEVKRLASLGSFSKGKNVTKDELVENGEPVILYSHLYTTYERVIKSPKYFISSDRVKDSTKIPSNTFLFTSSGELAEEIGKSLLYMGDIDVSVGGDLIIFTFKEDTGLHHPFFSFVFNSSTCQQQKSSMSRGEIVVHLYQKQLREVRVCVPPSTEQVEIARRLEMFESNARQLITNFLRRIELLKEYRQSLISSVVTGKVRVTEDMV